MNAMPGEACPVKVPNLFEKVVAYVQLYRGHAPSTALEIKIRLHVSNRASSIATLQKIISTNDIPKNKSGKICAESLRPAPSARMPATLQRRRFSMTTVETLNEIFRMVFDDDSIEVFPGMTAVDVDGWDSLSHVNLITTVEAKFKIRFTQKELLKQRNVGDLIADIEAKVAR